MCNGIKILIKFLVILKIGHATLGFWSPFDNNYTDCWREGNYYLILHKSFTYICLFIQDTFEYMED